MMVKCSFLGELLILSKIEREKKYVHFQYNAAFNDTCELRKFV